MKKCFNAAPIGVILILALAGCPQPETGDPFVPVTGIFGVPSEATAGTPLTLTGTVEPPDATNQTIVWSVIDAGTTGAVISGGNTLNTTAAGEVVVRATVANGLASGSYTKDFPPITVNYGDGTVGKLTITGSPPFGTIHMVYIFRPGTDITYEVAVAASANEGCLAVGDAPDSDGVFILYPPIDESQGDDFTGDGSYLVLLAVSGGSATDTANPQYVQSTVTFSNGAATASYGSFSAVVSDGDGVGRLTVTGLPSGVDWWAYVFSPGTDISTYDAITSGWGANGSYQAFGYDPGLDEAYILYLNGGNQGGVFTGEGSCPVLLENSEGSETDTGSPRYAQATVTFSGGMGTVSYGSFTVVVATVVDAFSLDGKLTAPVAGEISERKMIDDTQYTGNINWQTSGSATHTGTFAAFTVYQAVFTLYAKPNYIFDGLGANSFTYTGATAVTNVSGRQSVTITITFPATGEPRVVSDFSLDDKVTAPVTGGTPNTTEIDDPQYTGHVYEWQTLDGETHTGAFAASTVYQAVLYLAEKTGWTFDGVAANRFTYTGATTVSNAADSGTVTIIFPATADN